MKGNSSDYDEYLAQKHGGWQTADRMVDDVIEKAVGRRPIEKKRLIKGESNEVYELLFQDIHPLIIRISHKGDMDTFEGEKWGFDHCADLGLPVPEVLYVEHIHHEGILLSFSIETKLQGESLNELMPLMSQNNIKNILHEAGRILSVIHSIPTIGFGLLNGEGIGKRQTWEEVILRFDQKEKMFIDVAQKSSYDVSLMSKAFKLLRSHKEIYKDVESQLVHDDFSPKHILVKDNKIAGIIDMEYPLGGSPIFDFARWEFFHGESLPYTVLKDGYTNKKLFEEETFQTHFDLLMLHQCLLHIDHYNTSGYKKGVDSSFSKLTETLKSMKV